MVTFASLGGLPSADQLQEGGNLGGENYGAQQQQRTWHGAAALSQDPNAAGPSGQQQALPASSSGGGAPRRSVQPFNLGMLSSQMDPQAGPGPGPGPQPQGPLPSQAGSGRRFANKLMQWQNLQPAQRDSLLGNLGLNMGPSTSSLGAHSGTISSGSACYSGQYAENSGVYTLGACLHQGFQGQCQSHGVAVAGP